MTEEVITDEELEAEAGLEVALLESYDQELEAGKEIGKKAKVAGFLRLGLGDNIQFELSDAGKALYRGGMWRRIKKMYGNERSHVMASDRLTFTMPLVTFAKLFGKYAERGADWFAGLFVKESVMLDGQVRLDFEASERLGNVKEIVLKETSDED